MRVSTETTQRARRAALWIGAAAGLGLGLWFALADDAPQVLPFVATEARTDADARIQALEREVERLAAQVEWMAAQAAGGAPQRGRIATASILADEDQKPRPDPAIERGRRISQLETEFASERVDAAWSTTTEQALREIGSSDAVLGIEANPPVSQSIDCRSSRCRITFRFSTLADADDWTRAFSTRMGRSLPRSSYFTTRNDDGSAVVTMYGMK